MQNNVALTGENLRYEFYEPNLKRWYVINVYSPQYGYFVSIFTDITEHKKADEEINKTNSVLNGINQIFQAGLIVETEEKLAQTALKVVEEITGSSFGFICEITPKGLLNTIAISFTGWEECKIPHSQKLIMAKDLPIQGIRGRVIKDAKPMIFNDANSHQEWIEPPEGHTRIKSFLGVPLIYAGQVFGEIGLAHKDKASEKRI